MGTVFKNRGTSCVGVCKTGTTLIRVSTVMGTLYRKHRIKNKFMKKAGKTGRGKLQENGKDGIINSIFYDM